MSSIEEVKRMEHQLQSTNGRPSFKTNADECTRIVRISMTNPDETDSSNYESKALTSERRGETKELIGEIRINPIKPFTMDEGSNSGWNGMRKDKADGNGKGKQKTDDGNTNKGEKQKKTLKADNRNAARIKKRGRGAKKVESSNEETEGKKFRGVRLRIWGRWVADIRDSKSKKRLWLGTFDTAAEAAMAYDRAAIRLRGHKAVINLIPPPSEDISSGSNNPLP